MGYLCNYDVIKKKEGGIEEIRNRVCFAGHYTSFGKRIYKGVHIYVLKEYEAPYAPQNSYDHNQMLFTEDEVYKYCRALMQIGFNFTMEPSTVEFKPGLYKDNVAKDCYKFMIPFKENCPHANLILVNLIRHLHEDHFVEMTRWFLDNIDEENEQVPLLDRLMMATSAANGYNEGHTFAHQRTAIDISNHHKLHDHIFANNQKYSNTNILLGKYDVELEAMVNNKAYTLTEKHQKYKLKC